jgi:hypothetical protein
MADAGFWNRAKESMPQRALQGWPFPGITNPGFFDSEISVFSAAKVFGFSWHLYVFA